MAKKSSIAVSVSAFVERWAGKGYEKGETQRFWLDLLSSVFGVQNPTTMMEFELPVKKQPARKAPRKNTRKKRRRR